MSIWSTGERRAAGRGAVSPGRRRARRVFSALVMAVVAGMLLVTVVDPYAGATASSFYREPAMVQGSGVQRYAISGGYVLVDPKRDGYQAYTAPAPSAAKAGPGGGGSTGTSGSGGSYTTPVGVAQTYAAKAVAKRGWAPSEFSCLVSLWNRESGWNTHAANPGSGAYGIPQALPGSKMAAAGADWQNSYATQITWGLGYIAGSYGSPCGAWGHSNALGWY
ncbi:lytic transglycosylase domain-containing protein [Amnibacterium endophyticum]|uniref:Lytic transglycosylase domain-containing protein n=1 Tax=Amnibacterium endophyticum TaxID=2109337 RepID=A0ABW4LFF4_9MICO